MDFTVNQVVADRVAVVDLDFHKGSVLPGVVKDDGVLLIGEDIVSIGGKLFEIVAAKRQIGFADGVTVLVHREDFKQTVRRNDAAVRGGQILGSEQAKGHGGDLAVHANAELLILLQDLIQRNGGFLPFVIKVGSGFGDLDLLPGIGKLGGADLGIQHIAAGGCDLSDLIFSEIQWLAFGKSRFIGRYGIDHFTGRSAPCAVRRDNILGCGDLIDRTRQTPNGENRLIQSVRFGHGRKDFAGFADLDNAFLRHVRLRDLDHRNGVFLRGIVGGHIKIYRFAAERVAVGRRNLDQRIALAVLQLFGRNEIALAVRVECVDGGHFGIGEGLRDERPVRAVKPEACACQRNNLAGFGIHLDDLDIALKIAVVGKVAVGLPVFCNIHIKIGQKLPAVPALDLMNAVNAVG